MALVTLSLLLFSLILVGAVSVFRSASYGWALAGAILSVLVAVAFTITSLMTFPIPFSDYAHPNATLFGASVLGIIFILMGILSVVFLIKRKYEFD